jgi:hypothetical protein
MFTAIKINKKSIETIICKKFQHTIMVLVVPGAEASDAPANGLPWHIKSLDPGRGD